MTDASTRAREVLASCLDDPANLHGLRTVDLATCLAAIAQAHAAGRAEGLEEAAKVSDHYADEAETHIDMGWLGKQTAARWEARRLTAKLIGAVIRDRARINTPAGGEKHGDSRS
ncbi:MAG: hypothetical protein ACRYHC_02625 [Janthinobacterium lividum]